MKNTRPEFIVGNVLDVLGVLDDDCVDVVLTDPPYKDEDVVCQNGVDYYQFLSSWFEEAKRVTKDYVIFFNNASRLHRILEMFGEPFRVLIWTKPRVQYAWRWEPVFIYQTRAAPSWNINATIWSDIFPVLPLHKGEQLHPYEKPSRLMENLIRYIPKDKLILDTFCGVGTTNIACQKFQRQSIGIDINADYIKIAKKRCRVDILALQDFGVGDE